MAGSDRWLADKFKPSVMKIGQYYIDPSWAKKLVAAGSANVGISWLGGQAQKGLAHWDQSVQYNRLLAELEKAKTPAEREHVFGEIAAFSENISKK